MNQTDKEKFQALGRVTPSMEQNATLFTQGTNLAHIPDFGVWHLNIKQAAELIALDMWYSGEFPDIEEPEDWDGNENNLAFRSLLASQVTLFEERLITAIDNGKLSTAFCLRNFEEKIDSEKSYIEFNELQSWLVEHGYHFGDAFEDWQDKEAEIVTQVCNEISFLRTSIKNGGVIDRITLFGLLAKSGKIDKHNLTELASAYKAVVIENQQLREMLNKASTAKPEKCDRPLSTRQRRTMLTMIAALCQHAKIDIKARGTAQRIREMTEILGTSIDDETIKKIISEIPEAIESRLK